MTEQQTFEAMRRIIEDNYGDVSGQDTEDMKGFYALAERLQQDVTDWKDCAARYRVLTEDCVTNRERARKAEALTGALLDAFEALELVGVEVDNFTIARTISRISATIGSTWRSDAATMRDRIDP